MGIFYSLSLILFLLNLFVFGIYHIFWQVAQYESNLQPTKPVQTSSSDRKASASSNKIRYARLKELRREVGRTESRIEKLESEKSSCETDLHAPENAKDAAKLMELSQRIEHLDMELLELLQTWETLSEELGELDQS